MNQSKELLRVAGVSVLALGLAAALFAGTNGIVFAAAMQPETLSSPNANIVHLSGGYLPPEDYVAPTLNVIWDNNNGFENNQPKAGAMGYEEAAEIGARYISAMFGESIDGKTVEMLYAAWPHSSKTYWVGTVVNSADDLVIPEPSAEVIEAARLEGATTVDTGYVDKSLYQFSIDAVTGEWVSIRPKTRSQSGSGDLGTGKAISWTELEALQKTPPSRVGELSKLASQFAEKHFSSTAVQSVEFVRMSIPTGRSPSDLDADRITVYEKGRSITFYAIDDTGRVAIVDMDMDSGEVTRLDTSDSDFIPGYSYDGEDGVG